MAQRQCHRDDAGSPAETPMGKPRHHCVAAVTAALAAQHGTSDTASPIAGPGRPIRRARGQLIKAAVHEHRKGG